LFNASYHDLIVLAYRIW